MKQVIPGVCGFPLSNATKVRCASPHFAERTIGTLIEPRQLRVRAGRQTDIRISHVPLGCGHLFGVSHGASLLATSAPIRNYQVMVPLSGELVGGARAGRVTATPGTALVYSPGDCLHTYWSEDCVSLVLSVPAERLRGLARQSWPVIDTAGMRLEPLMQLCSGSGHSFANTLGLIAQEIAMPDSAYNRGLTSRMLEQTLLLSLLSAQLTAAAQAAPTPACDYMLCALDVIGRRCGDELGIADLAAAAGVSPRTLQYGFRERFGVGPLTYLKQYRLRKIHDTLRCASPASCTVGDVAARWGFYHGSAFAHSYRKLFGELPSQTLASRD